MIKKKMILAVLGLALSVGAAQSAFAASTDTTGNGPSVKQTQRSEWKDQTAMLKNQLVSLRTEQKALTEQIKTLHESNKLARKVLTKEQRAVLKESLKDLWQQIKAQHVSIQSLRAQKQALWVQVKEARQAGNPDGGVAALEQIISLKEQIIQAKQAILVLQQSLQAALNSTNI
jgi:hypothetical protein